MSFDTMVRETATWIPTSDIFLAQNLVNEAWRKIQDEREWSWLYGEGTLYSPAIITAGTCAVTQFGTTVTLDATASAAVLPFTAPTTAATSPLAITARQFRVGSSGAIYSITAANITNPAAIVLTLDRMFTEQTVTTSSFQIYRCYYQPVNELGEPITAFKYWLAIKVPIQGYVIEGANLYRTGVELNATDPQRGAQGQPYWLASYKPNANDNYAPLYEMWPHPTASMGYPTLYVRRAPELTAPTDVIPYQVSERLVIAKALSLLAEWADMNKGTRPELQKTNWTQVKMNREAEYQMQLRELKKLDNAQYITNWILDPYRGGRFGPWDSNFLQAHDVGGWGMAG